MNIEFENGRLVSKNVWFSGSFESELKFTINAHWNDWDDWSVDEIMWEDGEGTEEDKYEITEKFLKEMNG